MTPKVAMVAACFAMVASGSALAPITPGACTPTTFLAITLPAPVTIPGASWGQHDATFDTLYVEDRGGSAIDAPLVGVVSADLPASPAASGFSELHRPGYAFGYGTWLYAETNGEPGLQRGGASILPHGENGPGYELAACRTDNPDTLIF